MPGKKNDKLNKLSIHQLYRIWGGGERTTKKKYSKQ